MCAQLHLLPLYFTIYIARYFVELAGFDADENTQKLRSLFEKWKQLEQKNNKKRWFGEARTGVEIADVLCQYAQVEGDGSRREMIAREVAKLAARTEIRYAHACLGVRVCAWEVVGGLRWI
jgi:hypothetical protein